MTFNNNHNNTITMAPLFTLVFSILNLFFYIVCVSEIEWNKCYKYSTCTNRLDFTNCYFVLHSIHIYTYVYRFVFCTGRQALPLRLCLYAPAYVHIIIQLNLLQRGHKYEVHKYQANLIIRYINMR